MKRGLTEKERLRQRRGKTMNWIEHRLAERDSRNAHKKILSEGAVVVFTELQRSCIEAVQDYNRMSSEAGSEIQAKESSREKFSFSRVELGHQKEAGSVTVSLKIADATIFVDYGNGPKLPTFLIDLNGTSFVLTCERRPIRMQEATERILDSLLFADLPQTFPAITK